MSHVGNFFARVGDWVLTGLAIAMYFVVQWFFGYLGCAVLVSIVLGVFFQEITIASHGELFFNIIAIAAAVYAVIAVIVWRTVRPTRPTQPQDPWGD